MMKKETIKNIFDFLKEKEGKKHKDQDTLRWKLMFNEPLTEEDLNVKGDLQLANTKITSLPEGLYVRGDLYLTLCKNLTSLPKGLHVGGSLYLHFSEITSLPDDIIIDGGLNLINSKILTLPEGLEIKSWLNLTNTKITSLPKGLKVTKNLNLYNSLIQSLPEGLEVGGDVNINSTTLTKYTDKELRDMIKPGIIRGFIDR